MTNEFAKQASIYGWISKLTADAEYNAATAKAAVEQEYAAADEDIRLALTNSGQKFTEAVVRAQIILDEKYIKSQEEEQEAYHNFRVLRALSEALRMRSDMLISMGAHLRAESEMTGMHINKLDKQISKLKKEI